MRFAAAKRAFKTCHSRKVTSASSAAYFVASGTGTKSKVICALPVPTISLKAIGSWSK